MLLYVFIWRINPYVHDSVFPSSVNEAAFVTASTVTDLNSSPKSNHSNIHLFSVLEMPAGPWWISVGKKKA